MLGKGQGKLSSPFIDLQWSCSSSPSKQTCISLRLQEVKDIDLGGRYRQLCVSFKSGTVPIEHLLPLSPGTLRWISYINSALGLNTILTAFLFFHLLFFCEVGCSFFTLEWQYTFLSTFIVPTYISSLEVFMCYFPPFTLSNWLCLGFGRISAPQFSWTRLYCTPILPK